MAYYKLNKKGWGMLRAFLLALGILALASPSYAKVESGSLTALSTVAYGQGPTGIVPLKVDTDGSVYIGGSPTLDSLTVSGTITADQVNTTGADERISGTSAYIDFNDKTDQTIYIAGTVADATKLEVDGSIYVDNIIYATNTIFINTPYNSTTRAIYARTKTDSASSGIGVVNTTATTALNLWASNSGKGRIDVQSGGTDDLVINGAGAGKVAINDTTPVATLDVGGGTLTYVDGPDDLIVADDLEIDGSLYGDFSSDGSGKALCVTATGAIGTCTNTVGAGGTCTCS